MRRLSVLFPLLLAAALVLAGCASAPLDPDRSLADSGWAQASMVGAAGSADGWQAQAFPGKKRVDFRPVSKDGREALAATAASAASMVKHRVAVEPSELGSLRFSWKVPTLIADADMAMREADDSPVRIVLAFEGDRSKFSAADAMLSELAQALTGEPMPYATLMYVWCNKRAPGTVLNSPRTSRIRKIVLESGPDRLNRWLDYERDIRADYERAFGEPPGRLVGVAIMTDTDNTRSRATAWYGPVRLVTAGAPASR